MEIWIKLSTILVLKKSEWGGGVGEGVKGRWLGGKGDI